MFRRIIKDFLLSAGGMENLPAVAPASLYSVFLEGGFISDPYVSDNIGRAIDNMPEKCTFRAVIRVSEAEARAKHLYLKLSGIDLVGEIIFNDKMYARADNPNRVYFLEITDRVHAGDNELVIVAESPLKRRVPLDSKGNPVIIYSSAPYLPDMGIYSPIELIVTDNAIIKEVTVTQSHEANKITLMVYLETLGTDEGVRAIATLTSPTGELYYGGISMGHGIITVRNPHLWWPSGLGSPDLYKLTVTLYYNGEVTDVYERKIGLRHFAVAKDENGVAAVVVNGIKIFSKGATYISENSVYPRIKREATERLVQCAASANMNTLRVFSDRNAPPDDFLDLCDKYGILVWHDIPVHYVAPPITTAYASGISAAIRDMIARVSSHASCALFYFSVTEEVGGDSPPDSEAMKEFMDVSHRILRPIFERYAPGTEFIINKDELEASDERSITARLEGESAATLPSLPPAASIESFLGDRAKNILSPEFEAHVTIENGILNLFSELISKLRLPKGTVQLAYATEMSSALLLSDIIKAKRRDESATMSAVLRQFNEGWPSISPSYVDWYGRKKAEIFFAEDFFAPITVGTEREGNVFKFYVINDRRSELSGSLTASVYVGSECLFETSDSFTCPMLSSEYVIEADLGKYISGRGGAFITYQLSDKNGVITEGVVLPVLPKKFDFPEEPISAEITGFGKKYYVKLTSSGPEKGVFLSFVGMDAEFDRNFIDMTGLVPIKVDFTTSDVTTAEELMKRLEIRSLSDIGK